MTLHAWSTARFGLHLPPGHRFPLAKYAMLEEAVLAGGIVTPESLHVPERASVNDLLRVHGADYVDRFTNGTLGAAEVRRLGLPWSPGLVERSYRSVGGTVEAAVAALELGVTMSLSGGTHHAFADHGEGFCVFNDAAVAIRRLQADRLIRRAAIVDLDVHQGNGTHAIFESDESVLTFSMHGARNYPYMLSRRDRDAPTGAARGYGGRVDADVDIPLPDGTTDEPYMEELERQLPRAIAMARADIVIYLAGSDPHEGDLLGRMRLTEEGLARRDAMVLITCREVGLPVVVTVAGGYGRDLRDTVRVHANTARLAAETGMR